MYNYIDFSVQFSVLAVLLIFFVLYATKPLKQKNSLVVCML